MFGGSTVSAIALSNPLQSFMGKFYPIKLQYAKGGMLQEKWRFFELK